MDQKVQEHLDGDESINEENQTIEEGHIAEQKVEADIHTQETNEFDKMQHADVETPEQDTKVKANIKSDTASQQGAAAPAARPKIFSEKGRQYEIDKIEHNFDSLNKLSAKITEMINERSSFDSIRAKHSLRMDKYEDFIEKHQTLMQRIHEKDKEAYIRSFEQKGEFLQTFKASIEEFFRTSSVKSLHQQTDIAKVTSQKSKTSSKHSSATSSKRSSISSKKLREEQKRAELETRMQSLEKKRQIELAKTQIKLDEEEFKLTTDLAISDAKSKVLEKFENEAEVSDGSEESSVPSVAVSEKSRYKKSDKVRNTKDNSDIVRHTTKNTQPLLSVHAKEFVPNKRKIILPTYGNENTDRYDLRYNDTYRHNATMNEENDIASVVKTLTKAYTRHKTFWRKSS